jgi:trans-aconitate 2-methyltransferase
VTSSVPAGSASPPDPPSSDPHARPYTFGTTPTAAQRLALLAALYEPDSRALLARWAPRDPTRPPPLAIDLGCGPGHTARLVHEVTGARRTTGVERSPEFAALARAEAPEGVEIVEGDVTAEDLPIDPADVVHARFLLTHLSAPARALRGWGRLLRPDGVLILVEVARLVSRDTVLGRYYELVADLQQHHGQALDIGARLGEIAGGVPGLRVVHSGLRAWNPPTAAMAGLHVLNLRTWRTDRYAAGAFDPDELDALDDALLEIARGRPAEPIEQELAEVVLTTA